MIIVFECYSAGMNLSNGIPTGVSSISFVGNGLIESSVVSGVF